ncbi:FadR/GntR family transcriptional regulator [Pedobacter sp. R20-19]|uniref:FadR/GntR family transcriptional regulator n=1 Tax=Pedobacter sp. R20-19 TaxID=1270196 RepID=UPI00049347DE|nr:FCD domain-containing protein [Pedobacter sp. R20-19]
MNSSTGQKSLSQKISAAIRADILDGKFEIGSKIPSEPDLMVSYGVGRSTIREAIKSLSQAGVLTVRQGYGTIVNDVSSEPIEERLKNSDFKEINYVRGLLEKEIVTLAVKNRNDQHLSLMEKALAKRKAAIVEGNHENCIAADLEFHTRIAEASGNKVLFDLYKSFTSIIRDFFTRREPSGLTQFAMSHHLHETLLAAIKEQHMDQAIATIAYILNNNH